MDEMRYYYREEFSEMEARPEREEIIGNDDILNLRIALELSHDVRDFLQDQHIFVK